MWNTVALLWAAIHHRKYLKKIPKPHFDGNLVCADESGLLLKSKKSSSCVFVKNRRSPVFNPELTLSGCILPFKSVVKDLGIVMDTFRLTSVSVEARIRKFFGGVNSVLG